MQATLRFISLILIVTGLILMGADVVTSLDKGGEITVRSIEKIWAMFSPGSIAAFKEWIGRTAPWAAQGVATVLGLWGWAVTGVLGVILNFLSGRSAAGAR